MMSLTTSFQQHGGNRSLLASEISMPPKRGCFDLHVKMITAVLTFRFVIAIIAAVDVSTIESLSAIVRQAQQV